MNFDDFKDVRIRIQRLRDAKLFHGWVDDIDQASISVCLHEDGNLIKGDRCFIEISGIHEALSLEADISDVKTKDAHFRIASPLNVRKAYEEARIRQSMKGTLTLNEESHPILADDMSINGIGILCKFEIEPWNFVNVTISTPFGEINVRGQIRYCRPNPDAEWPYRAGVFAKDLTESLGFVGKKLLRLEE